MGTELLLELLRELITYLYHSEQDGEEIVHIPEKFGLSTLSWLHYRAYGQMLMYCRDF